MQSNLVEFQEMSSISMDEEEIQKELSLTDVATFSLIEEKIETARAMVADLNIFSNNSSKQIAEKAIRLGGVLMELKSLIRKSDEAWEQWADMNLPFVGKRTRQKCMRLAKRQDCHPYTDLGVERLDMLCSATKNDEGEDPIGTLLTKYRVIVDEKTEIDLEDFKGQVDVIVSNEKLERKNIPVSLELVSEVTSRGIGFDERLLKKLSNIQCAGGNPEDYLQGLLTPKEKGENEPPAEVKLKDSFNSLANKMIQKVDFILKNPTQISKVDQDFIKRLIEKLRELQAVVDIKTVQAEAA